MKIKQLGGSNSNAHKIICLNTKKQFDTIKEAGEWCSAFPENISQACQRQGACGTHPDTGEALYWCLAEKYTETVQREFELNKNKLIKKRIAKIKQVQQLDLKTNEVLATYKSCAEAAQIVLQDKTKSKGISRCACGDRNHAYGYKWRYIT